MSALALTLVESKNSSSPRTNPAQSTSARSSRRSLSGHPGWHLGVAESLVEYHPSPCGHRYHHWYSGSNSGCSVPDPGLPRRWLGYRYIGSFEYHLWDYPIDKPLAWCGGFPYCSRGFHAGGGHLCNHSSIPPAFESCYHSGLRNELLRIRSS